MFDKIIAPTFSYLPIHICWFLHNFLFLFALTDSSMMPRQCPLRGSGGMLQPYLFRLRMISQAFLDAHRGVLYFSRMKVTDSTTRRGRHSPLCRRGLRLVVGSRASKPDGGFVHRNYLAK